MKFFLFIIFLFLFSCSSKITQVYICGDHPCINKKEMKEYFDNNISVEVFTITSDKKNKEKFTLVDLNLMKDDDNKDKKKNKNLSSVKSKEDVKKIIKKRKKLTKLKLKENKAKEQKKVDKTSKIKSKNTFKNKKREPITFVRICKNLEECDIDKITKIIMDMGKKNPFPDISAQ
jgi:hypothetical protein|tara:strand:- start:41 stop:565 length:525 start_codon:yes stop_codon:yes gene_type:complete